MRSEDWALLLFAAFTVAILIASFAFWLAGWR